MGGKTTNERILRLKALSEQLQRENEELTEKNKYLCQLLQQQMDWSDRTMLLLRHMALLFDQLTRPPEDPPDADYGPPHEIEGDS